MGEIGRTTRTARAILEVLKPLTGDPSTGTATVTATSADTLLPKRCFFAPLRKTPADNESLDRDNLIRTTADAVINSTGVSVPIISMLGGVRQNLLAGTRLLLDPALTGIEPYAVVDAPGMVGGLTATGVGSVKQIVEYETLTSGTTAIDLFNARVQNGAPAIVLAWESSGSATARGRGISTRPDRWVLYVVTARGDGAGKRRDEARDILDAIESYLNDRKSVAGHVFSAPATAVQGRSRLTVTKTSYIYAVALETGGQTKRVDTRGATSADGEMTFTEWKTTRLDSATADVPPFPIVSKVIFDMLLGGFTDGFSAGFRKSGVID